MTLPGYHLGENLYQGTRTLVYRGTRTTDSQTVIIKLLRNEYPTFAELAQFRNQYAITKNLNLSGIVQPLALENYGNGYALVMPSQGYISLGQWQQGSLNMGDFLSIALQLADILHQLDRHRVIHKDIKPANILIHPQTKHVQLIDFSISSRLPKETQEISSPNTLEGTLAYLSPEQTGRMNRGIDYRSDFYSLGVTFYELLTGELPFHCDDPMELVHCHLARCPMPPDMRKNEIPQILSQLVLKLMAKNAEDRYQSALGLKYDLEKCLVQWKETSHIEPFELGERDICDRFIIPEQLYGREAEVERLLAAFGRVASPLENRVAEGNTEMMLVAGFSGIGKTAVINEIHKPITRQQGYFIQGKFDQFNRNVPLSAFVQAFRSLIKQLLGESDAALAMWKADILDAVGVNGQVLIEVIPELEAIIDAQPAVPELSGSAAQNRFNLLFGKFARVFATPEHPLVIFLDDLQWADLASLNLLKLLLRELASGYLFVLGAYRDNEVFPAHPLMLTLDEIDKPLETLTLAPLQESDITQLLADTLLCSPERATPLSHLVYQKTQGNPFFTTQFLQGLYEEGCITFEVDAGYWQCDLARVRQLALTSDVVEFLVGRLQKLPQETQEVLKLAACIGNQFDLGTLAVVCEESPDKVATDLWCALNEGFVVPQSETYKFFQGDECQKNGVDDVVGYRFLHDRVQQAAYSLIPDAQKHRTHWRIGQLLLQGLSESEKLERIFDLVNQLNLGKAEISTQEEKQILARLNLQAGQKAKLSAAYKAAQNYCTIGIGLLSKKTWKTDYKLTYSLHRYSSEAAYLSGDFDRAESLYSEAIAHARTPLDKVIICRVQMTQYQLQGRNSEAVKIQRQSLEWLGYNMPVELKQIQTSLDREIVTVEKKIEKQTVESILELTKMKDPNIAEMLRILQILFYSAWLDGQPTLALLAVAKMTTLSLHNGNSDVSPFGYVGYGMIANELLKDYETAHRFGKMAVQLCEQFDNADVRGMTNFLFAADVQSWSRPIRQADRYYENAYKYGMDAGNWLTVSFMMIQSGSDRLTYGKNLDELYAIAQTHAAFLRHIKSLDNLDGLMAGVIQPIRNLLGLTKTPLTFDDEEFKEAQYLKKHENNAFLLSWLYSVQIRHAYLFENTAAYPNSIEKLSTIEQAVSSHTKVPSSVFYVALMHLALVETVAEDVEVQIHWQALALLEEQLKRWATACPENLLHKCWLIQGEKARLNGQKAEAIEYYDRAIAGAQANQYIQEEALANELAAKFYLDWGKDKIAQTYMLEAYYCYARWGAKAKTDHLEATYPQLLTPILQQPKSPFGDNATSTCTSQPTLHSSTKTTTSILDVTSAIKASQALSGEIELEALLSKLMNIVLENAGADKGALILQNTGTWEVAAFCEGGACHLCLSSLDGADTLPMSIIRTVQRTQQTIVLNRVEKDAHFSRDADLKQQQPKSLCCTPILNQGRLIGILYLENNLSEEAFTQDRVEVLNLLCSQAAIALENARLYENAQAANKMLQKSLEDLKQAQLQIVQSEKMSALGNLVSGIAHEINNPVGFIGGNLQPARDYIQDLFGLIDLYREKYPDGDEEIEEEIEAIDLDFLREDLPKLMGSMKLGAERIAHISKSLRTFSRTDQEHKVPFNIHDGIDSTLLILKHRLKANEQRPKIGIIKHYGNIPEIRCFPGQLNQVFMNLIANAIDALEDSNEGCSFEEIAAYPNRITIQTQIHKEQVIIQIADNGVGIPENVKARIFEQGFTTKGVGKGTGLGMAIARQIIKEKHGGTISCSSEPGKGTEFAIALSILG